MTDRAYDLYLESGPKRRRTMVHVPALLGCMATGATTDEALSATPDAIRAFQAFLARHGESVTPGAPFETRVAEHITQGDWLGNGSPYIIFASDWEELTEAEIEAYLAHLHWLHDDLANWFMRHADALDATLASGGRTARAIGLHVLGACGTYFAAALGGATGFSRLHTRAERGELALPDALREAADMVAARARTATPAERSTVRQLPSGSYTYHKAMRRTLEHAWEHLAEVKRRG